MLVSAVVGGGAVLMFPAVVARRRGRILMSVVAARDCRVLRGDGPGLVMNLAVAQYTPDCLALGEAGGEQ